MKNIGFSFDKEDIYSHGKRLRFIRQVIEDYCQRHQKPIYEIQIVDAGCGTGIGLTFPIASLGCQILGIDKDSASVEEAKKMNIYSNASFASGLIEEKTGLQDADIIICSEVLEHVPKPLELLFSLKRCLKQEGIIILTVPNGYGWFEMEKFFYESLRLKSAFNFLNKIIPIGKLFNFQRDLPLVTLDEEDGHLQRFTPGKLDSLFNKAGLRIAQESRAGIFGGQISENFLGGCKPLLKFNNWLGDILPPFFAIDWYFVLRLNEHDPEQ